MKYPVWKGNVLAQKYGRFTEAVGEVWETSVRESYVLTDDGEVPFADYLESVGLEHHYPLIKLIDAALPLSLQVHPDKEAAEELGGRSKNEFWYVLEAKPDASLIYGTVPEAGETELREKIGTDGFERLCKTVKVQPGDVFPVPAGLIHSLGAGITVIEIQDFEGDTYRVLDLSGGGRELHINESKRSVKKISEDELDKFGYYAKPAALPGEIITAADGFTVSVFESDGERGFNVSPAGTYVFVAEGKASADGVCLEEGYSYIFPCDGTEVKCDKCKLIFVK